MGDMADDLNNQIFDYYLERASRIHYIKEEDNSPPFTWWVQRTGIKIKITDMTEQHLRNSIAMINRNSWRKWRIQWLEYLEKELKNR